MNPFLMEVCDQLNLRWAWEKVRRQSTPGDNWFDEVEVASFDLELEQNLRGIATELHNGRYRLAPLRPLPFPKDPDKFGFPRVRQLFHVAVRDQVAWTAVVNVVGPHADCKMPAWSYGNRLYRSIWVDEESDGRRRRKIGQYRHASGQLYLPFGQSWPVFRRHVYLATRAMTLTNEATVKNLDEPTQEELDFQELLAQDMKNQHCPFVLPEYWRHRKPQDQTQELYWCSIDLKKFYPTFNLDIVRSNIVEQLPGGWRDDADRLLESMLKFRLNVEDWNPAELKKMNLRAKQKFFKHIPTGLYVAGFLANSGLMKVDHEVVERLKSHNVAHFRFVDDHIALAYSMRDLVQWVREYTDLLRESGTQLRINPDKIEPKELTRLITEKRWNRSGEEVSTVWRTAERASLLDPEFPSPLMTKTLALISALARTDFNLLESQELTAITDQLEHLLLVDIPEEEIQEKTRLSFAATRLTRIAECRLANPETRIELSRRRDSLVDALGRVGLEGERREEVEQELREVRKKLHIEKNRLGDDVERAFQLLRRVLRKRPDRTRLWTRALLMCRSTGVKGIGDLLGDIHKEYKENPLAGEYLYANMLVLAGTQAFIAARIIRDVGVANWRRQAARSFLEELSSVEIGVPGEGKIRWFLRMSWLQYCFGLYCADLVLRQESESNESSPVFSFPEKQLALGRECSKKGSKEHGPAQWVWWAGRMTLRDLESRAAPFIKVLGKELEPSREARAFWRFFPLDVPTSVITDLVRHEDRGVNSRNLEGWWIDAFRGREAEAGILLPSGTRHAMARVRRALTVKRKDLSLYDWCENLRQISRRTKTDPRCGEWSALEIVRQIAGLVGEEPTLSPSYLRDAQRAGGRLVFVHPANFRIPKTWLEKFENKEPTWNEWKGLTETEGKSIVFVPEAYRIEDNRYTPLNPGTPLFLSVNPVRGLGLLLYGLLRKSFELPVIWNGPGHAEVLGMLPKLLLTEMTCSSWTLGVLFGCLQSRAVENLFLRVHHLEGYSFDDDTLRDPLQFRDTGRVSRALMTCQDHLKRHQLSTLNHSARQITPVSIRQLAKPEWNKDFEGTSEGEGSVRE